MLHRMIVAALGVACAAATATAQPACPPYPVTLQNGTIADATEVMSDFNAIRDCVNNNLAVVHGALTSGGSANAQTLSPPGVTQYSAGLRLLFQIGGGLTNTAAATLNVNGLGAKNVFLWDGASALSGGELIAGRYVEVEYDGTQFRLLSAPALGHAYTLKKTAANIASLDFVIPPWADEVQFEVNNLVPATNGAYLYGRVSIGGYRTDSSYSYNVTVSKNSAITAGFGQNQPLLVLTSVLLNAGGFQANGTVKIRHPNDTTLYKIVHSFMSVINQVLSLPEDDWLTGYYNASLGAVDGFRFGYSSGNISSGTVTMRCWKNS